ncbi:MAG: prepilin-type N-terminal cleavage/methylation domain-containing protein [Betaproteobacteria bacterium]|nr:prepilin-type N-terminal cleavage/methylation domain-containing protein [Betaproteobacteria bacterium]
MRKQQGFTLIEIAIVLVIIGLLLGGVLKGQELITSARVRNLISQQDGVKAAFFGFLDRYRAYPGDYNQAQANIPSCAACAQGNNNGQIRSVAGGDVIDEQIAVWEHLSRAGFINGSYTYAAGAETTASAPTNPYARYLQMIYDNVYDGAPTVRHNLKTGNQIPSDILAEVDRKVDDGSGTGGSFRFSAYPGQSAGGGTAPVGSGSCYAAAAPNNWVANAPVPVCGGTSLF